MPEFCTCGVELVPDARFCHKCGRPVREEDRAYEIAAATPPPPLPDPAAMAPPAAIPEIGFQNRVAVRIAALLAICLFVVTSIGIRMLGGGGFIVLPSLFGMGFLSVAMYRRRTGAGVSVISGARMGWICGVFVFVIVLVLMTLMFMAMQSVDMQEVERQWKESGQNTADFKNLMEAWRDPLMVLMLLATSFVSVTTIPSLGGALGAAMLNNSSSSSSSNTE